MSRTAVRSALLLGIGLLIIIWIVFAMYEIPGTLIIGNLVFFLLGYVLAKGPINNA